jgi:hypothetical protein
VVGGWTLYTTVFRVNSANLANKHSTKLGTLNCSAHARTVRPLKMVLTGSNPILFSFDTALMWQQFF